MKTDGLGPCASAMTRANFKVHEYEGTLSPSGMWVVLRALEEPDFWGVRVMNFATWKHTEVEFESETAARKYVALWLI